MTPVAVLFARTDSVYKTQPAVAGPVEPTVRHHWRRHDATMQMRTLAGLPYVRAAKVRRRREAQATRADTPASLPRRA